jgi:hypothetical protein
MAAGKLSVLPRHYPELTPADQNVAKPFAPWKRVGVAAQQGRLGKP